MLLLGVLSGLKDNRSDFCPALRQINKHSIWNRTPRIFMCAKRGMSGMWTWQVTPLYPQIRLADDCLLPLSAGVATVCVCLPEECV